jgi:type II secretory pathway pseudopilin PulG
MEKLHEEEGFTLPEALVSMVMMAVVLFALYAVFDASVRVFGAGRDEAEAAQNARLGLARMEREIRSAYPRDKADGDTTLLTDFGETHIVFGNDLDGDRRIGDPAESVSYATNTAGVPTRNGVRLVESAGDVDGEALTFEYLDAEGATATEEADVAMVGIRLEISVDGPAGSRPVERILRTTVALRNR